MLYTSVKVPVNPIYSLKNQLINIYEEITEEFIKECKKPEEFKKIIFSCNFLFSMVVERQKYQDWKTNFPISYQDSDHMMRLAKDMLNEG